MGKLVYTGVVQVAAAAQFGYADLNPPEREGYANEITRAMFYANESAATNAAEFIIGCSAKVPKRTTLDGTEVFDLDMIVVGQFPYRPSLFLDSFSTSEMIVHDDPYFLDEVRIVLATQDGAVHANGLDVYYRLEVEEKKLTDKVRDLIHLRSYS